MDKRLAKQALEDTEFQEIIKDIFENEKVKEMKKYRIHGNTSCYTHCYDAAYYCYLICKKKRFRL
jgi:HD superfamily phosphodiesterase